MKRKINLKDPYFIIGAILLIHYILLVFDRLQHNMLYNLLWISHLTLLLAAAAFLTRSNIMLTGALLSVLVFHGLWIYDFMVLTITGVSPLSYSAYVLNLSNYRRLLTMHHIYLIPLLLITLIKERKISPKGWIFASSLFAIATFSSFFFVRPNLNLNCARIPCPALLQLFPNLGFLSGFQPVQYLVSINIFMSLFGFLLPNLIFYWLFATFLQKSK